MHIQGASVSMRAQHQFQRQHQTRVIAGQDKHASRDQVKQFSRSNPPHSIETQPLTELPFGSVDASVLKIKQVLESYLGKEIVLANYYDSTVTVADEQLAIDMTADSSPAEQWLHLSLREKEVSEFSVQAEITLADGTTRQVIIEQAMARELSLNVDVTSSEAAKIIDPLVINFSGPVALSHEKVDFDLNADGKTESIASFASNSAFLALDRNGDGKINDGSELFGAMTGNGFAELAEFDEDGNGFIDHNDSVFAKLLLFDPAKQRTRHLVNKDIQALYLDSVATPFTLQDLSLENKQQDLGYVRSTGFYLTQHGAGTMQQIDLVV